MSIKGRAKRIYKRDWRGRFAKGGSAKRAKRKVRRRYRKAAKAYAKGQHKKNQKAINRLRKDIYQNNRAAGQSAVKAGYISNYAYLGFTRGNIEGYRKTAHIIRRRAKQL